MKRFKKLLCSMVAVFIAVTMSLTLCVGCSSNKKPNGGDSTVLTISFWKAGWGDEYIKSIVAAFEEAYPEYTVDLQSSTDGFVFANTIDLGAEMNDVDLYIGSFMNTIYNNQTEPLNDLLNENCYGENVTLGQKLGKDFKTGLTFPDGKIYGLPEAIGGYRGLIYNADMIGDGTDYDIPVTTDELEMLVNELLYDESLNGVKPFIHYGNGDYWKRVYEQWWVQYDGKDDYYDFLALKDADGNAPSKSVITAEDGRYKSLEVLDAILSEDTTYAGSNKLSYQQAQTIFMNGGAVMMANGNWLINEMKMNTEATAKNLKIMRTPVISSIIEKCPSIEDDDELAALIRTIDTDVAWGRGTSVTGTGYSVTQDDLDRVKAARFYSEPGNDSGLMVIPEYSTAKDAAKAFIKFYYSDASVTTIVNTLHVPTVYESTSLSIDRSGWSDFENGVWELAQHAELIMGEAVNVKSDLFTYGGLQIWATQSPTTVFTQHNRTGLSEYWNSMLSYYESAWDNAVENAEARG